MVGSGLVWCCCGVTSLSNWLDSQIVLVPGRAAAGHKKDRSLDNGLDSDLYTEIVNINVTKLSGVAPVETPS